MQTNLIRALGDSRLATIMLSGGLIVNIIFEPIFLLGFGLGVPGAALATAASQVIANLICFFYIFMNSINNFFMIFYFMILIFIFFSFNFLCIIS